MHRYIFVLLLSAICFARPVAAQMEAHIGIVLYPYEFEGSMKAAAMPELKAESELMPYKRRFEYLLYNVPEIHMPGKIAERNVINSLYPDSAAIVRQYLDKYLRDKSLVRYFEETMKAIQNPQQALKHTYSAEELMEVASKFFYCDRVEPDTSIQAHVCVGLNGVKEANWQEDYTLLEAFCYEAIFKSFDKDNAAVWNEFVAHKKASAGQLRQNITDLNQYLLDVRLAVFQGMKNSDTLKNELLEYYHLNRDNLAFGLVE